VSTSRHISASFRQKTRRQISWSGDLGANGWCRAGTENATRPYAFDLGTGGVIYKRVFNVPPKSSLLRGCRGELEIAKGHGIARLIREETKCPPIPSSPIKVSHQTGL
jgi:hypothetical protein